MKNGEHPILLQVIHNRRVKRLSLGYYCLPKQRNEETAQFRKNMSNYQSKNLNLKKWELLASDIIDDCIRQ